MWDVYGLNVSLRRIGHVDVWGFLYVCLQSPVSSTTAEFHLDKGNGGSQVLADDEEEDYVEVAAVPLLVSGPWNATTAILRQFLS